MRLRRLFEQPCPKIKARRRFITHGPALEVSPEHSPVQDR